MLTGLLNNSCAVLTSFSSLVAVGSELLLSATIEVGRSLFLTVSTVDCTLTPLSAILAVSSEFSVSAAMDVFCAVSVSAISDVAASDFSGAAIDTCKLAAGSEAAGSAASVSSLQLIESIFLLLAVVSASGLTAEVAAGSEIWSIF